jgi:hypothetical protein
LTFARGLLNHTPKWIDRRIAQTGDLNIYKRLIFYGRMKVGKTQEAIEFKETN